MGDQQRARDSLNLFVKSEPPDPNATADPDPGASNGIPLQPIESALADTPYHESPISTLGQPFAPAGFTSRSTPSLPNHYPRERRPSRSMLGLAPNGRGQPSHDPPRQRLVLQPDTRRAGIDPSRTKSADTQTIWEAVIEQFKWHDEELIEEWQRSMDVLLIFAALFAGILTAFLVESSRLLREEYPRTTALLLAQIAQNMGTNTSALAVATLPPFEPSAVAKRVNRAWFASLALTIASAIFAMLAKQWITEYTSGVSSEMSFDPLHTSVERLREEVRIRQFRVNGLRRWKVQEIIGGLPIVLHIALLIFAVGLVDYLWSLDQGTAIVLLTIVSVVFFLYAVSAIIPSHDPSCSYKTPLSHLLTNWRRAFYLALIPKVDSHTSIIMRVKSGFRQASDVHGALLENEKEAVVRQAIQLDKECLGTLKRITRDSAVAVWAEEELEALLNSTRRPDM